MHAFFSYVTVFFGAGISGMLRQPTAPAGISGLRLAAAHLLSTSLDAALLWQRGQFWGSAAYAVASVVPSVAGVFLGLVIIRHLPI